MLSPRRTRKSYFVMTRVATAQDSEVLLISTTVYNDIIIMHASRNLLREQQAVMHNAYDISYNQSVSLPVLLNENLVYTPVAYTALLRDIYIYFEAYIYIHIYRCVRDMSL